MRRSRAVPVVLLAVAMLQVGALWVMVGAILGAHAPATAATPPPPRGTSPRVDVAAPSRGAEIVEIPVPGRLSPIRARVVYPERLPAPTVMIVPVAPATPSAGPASRASRADLLRLSDWVRSIAGAVAAEGFIAVAPDSPASATPGQVGPYERSRWFNVIRAWARDEAAANGQLRAIGFSWGGSTGIAYPVDQPELSALVVFHGYAPAAKSDSRRLTATVLGLFGGGIPTTPAEPWSARGSAGEPFEVFVHRDATVFLRAGLAQQVGRAG